MVVLIIGILSAVALPQYTKAVEKSRAAEAVLMLKSIAQANQGYKLATGVYTAELADLDFDWSGTKINDRGQMRWGTKNFYYGGEGLGITPKTIAVANRLPINAEYWMVVFADKPGFYCNGVSAEGIDLCKSLSGGKKDGQYYVIE